jgi:hypothetical protein
MPGRFNPPPTKRGYDVFECISAIQKCCRRSDVDQALYWATELFEAGFAAWLFKRLKTIVSEDIGPAAPGLAADVRALYENWKDEKANNGGYLYMAHAVVIVAMAPKCRVVDWVAHWHGSDFVPRREIPDEALDQHTQRGRKMKRGVRHFVEEGSKLINYDGPDIYELEQHYLALAERKWAKDSTLTPNPFVDSTVQEQLPVGDNNAGDGSGVSTHRISG